VRTIDQLVVRVEVAFRHPGFKLVQIREGGPCSNLGCTAKQPTSEVAVQDCLPIPISGHNHPAATLYNVAAWWSNKE
jgi:hypothetical protein